MTPISATGKGSGTPPKRIYTPEHSPRPKIATILIQFFAKLALALTLLLSEAVLAEIRASSSSIRFQRLLNGDAKEIINTVHATLQDDNGFIWFGGENGIARYDGHVIKIYQHDPNNPHSLSSNAVWDIEADHDGVLWFATSNGLSRYNRETDDFRNMYSSSLTGNAMRNSSVRDLAVDSENNMLIATDGGLSILSSDRKTFTNYRHDPNDPNSIAGNLVRAVYIDHRDLVWLGLYQNGLVRLDRKSGQLKNYRHNPDLPYNSLVNDSITSIAEDKSGKIWIGTFGGGISRMDPKTERFTNYKHSASDKYSIGSDTIWKIYQDSFQNLWFATDHGGLARYRWESDDFEHFVNNAYDENSLISNQVRSIYEDEQGDLWVGTFPVGTNFYDRSSAVFSHLIYKPNDPNSLANSSITKILESRDGLLWIGTEGGLTRYDPKTSEFKRYQADSSDPYSLRFNAVISLEEDFNGDLWVGTWSGGLHRFDRKTERFYNYYPNPKKPGSINSAFIWSLLVDSDNNLWVGTEKGGLNLYNRETDNFTAYRQNGEQPTPHTVSNDFVWTMMEDSKGHIWIGTLNGLDRYDKNTKTFTHYVHSPADQYSLSNNRIISLLEDSKGQIWAGTQGGGLNILNPETHRVKRIDGSNGLPSVSISSIVEDFNKDIWVTTDKGIARISPEDFAIKTYEKSNGLVGNNYNRDASYIDANGLLYLGSTEGITIFDPNNLKIQNQAPEVVLTDFKIFNKSILPGAENSPLKKSITLNPKIELNHTQSVFSFAFAALSYRSSVNNKYKYILEGFDKHWQEVGNNNTAVYTNIDPGRYKFIVKGANADGVWNDQGASVNVIILPPPWKTWWAYTLYIAALALIIFSVVRNKMKRVELEQERSVNAQLIKLDKMKDAFLANTSHELRTPLNGIIGLAESLVESNDTSLDNQSTDRLKMIVSSSKRLASLINDILDLSKLRDRELGLKKRQIDLYEISETVIALLTPLIGSKELKLINEIPIDECIIHADENRIQQILINLIGNAIKYTDKGHVKLSCQILPKKIVISIEDTGIGMPSSELNSIFESFNQIERSDAREYGGTGLGLAITKELVELHGGEINVESEQNKGSTFSITIPTEVSRKSELESKPVEKQPENKPVIADLDADIANPGLIDNDSDQTKKSAPEQKTAKQKSKTNQKTSSEQKKNILENIPKLDNPENFKILIVDDDPINRMVLNGILSLQNYSSLEAGGGEEALKLLDKHPDIDLIFLDVMMPVMTGYECCQIIRETHSRHELPIIFLTAKDFGEDMVKSFCSGGNDFITKPVKKEELLSRLHVHLTTLEAFRKLNANASSENQELESAPPNGDKKSA